MANTPLLLVDASGFIWRAFHALPPLTRADGVPIGAVMGFCNMILRLIEMANGARIAVIFDAGRHSFRHDIDPTYKANRAETPPDLVPQFPLVRDAARAFGFAVIETEGFEADDLIASYAHAARAHDQAVTIISSDKDLMQLMADGVGMLDPIKFTPIGPDKVLEKFGVTPDKVVEVQALIGDAVDNVRGVPSIGPKTAAELINQFGTVEGVLANLDQIKQPKRREVLAAHADDARLSRRLVQLKDDCPLPVPIDQIAPFDYDADRLLDFCRSHGLRTLEGRLRTKFGDGGASALSSPSPDAEPAGDTPLAGGGSVAPSYLLIRSLAELQDFLREVAENGILAIDTETTGLTPAKARLVGISLATGEGRACYIPIGHGAVQPSGAVDAQGGLFTPEPAVPTPAEREPDNLPSAGVMAILAPLLTDPAVLKVGQNLKYDLQVLALAGAPEIAPIDDTMVLSYVVDGGQAEHGLDALALRYLDHTMISYDSVTGTGKNRVTMDRLSPQAVSDYAAEDADMTLRLWSLLRRRLFEEKATAVYDTLDRPLVPILARMEANGIKIDVAKLHELSYHFSRQADVLATSIYEQTGQHFNLASPKQMGDVLFGAMGLPHGKKTKTGAWATDAKTLEDLAAQGHKVVDDILSWRQLTKLISTYTEALPQAINPRTGRVHTSFTLTVTNTGRLSSTDPNLQNIPIRSDDGRQIRTAFVAEAGHRLICLDYSQIELRLVAEMAGIERLKQAFRDGLDIHAATAAEVFGLPLDQVTADKRRAAKAINFGIIYGISGYGLGRQLGVEPAVANAYIKEYMARFPELATFMERTKEFARQHGYVETLWGRKCWIPNIRASGPLRAFAERQAINAPLQGTAADIVKRAMIVVDRYLLDNPQMGGRLLLQVHDELVVEAPETEAAELGATLGRLMEGVCDLSIPLVVGVGTGPNWDQAH